MCLFLQVSYIYIERRMEEEIAQSLANNERIRYFSTGSQLTSGVIIDRGVKAPKAQLAVKMNANWIRFAV